MFFKKIRIFIRLSFRRKFLLFLNLVFSIYSYLAFRYFKQGIFFGKPKFLQQEVKLEQNLVDDIRFAIYLLAKYTPWENVCRHQAYQAKILCNLYKIPYQIFVGFKKNTETSQIEGHAWTVVNNQIITGFCKPEEYTVQSIYSNT